MKGLLQGLALGAVPPSVLLLLLGNSSSHGRQETQAKRKATCPKPSASQRKGSALPPQQSSNAAYSPGHQGDGEVYTHPRRFSRLGYVKPQPL